MTALLALAVLLIVLGVVGGLTIHPLVFLLIILAVVVILVDRRGRV